jgi:hypothetical protein
VAVGSRKYQELMVSASLAGRGQGGWGTMTSMYVHIPYDSQQPTKRISCQTPQSWLHKPRCTGERSLPPELGWPGETQTRSGRLTGAPHLSPVLQETSRLGWSAGTWSPTPTPPALQEPPLPPPVIHSSAPAPTAASTASKSTDSQGMPSTGAWDSSSHNCLCTAQAH